MLYIRRQYEKSNNRIKGEKRECGDAYSLSLSGFSEVEKTDEKSRKLMKDGVLDKTHAAPLDAECLHFYMYLGKQAIADIQCRQLRIAYSDCTVRLSFVLNIMLSKICYMSIDCAGILSVNLLHGVAMARKAFLLRVCEKASGSSRSGTLTRMPAPTGSIVCPSGRRSACGQNC